MSINRVILTGNLTRDPELLALQSGTPVLNFSLAVNERVRNRQTDEWEERANYIDCSLFGPRGQSLHHILAKGMKVAVEGRLRWRSWEGKDGTRRSKVDVVVDDVELMSRGDQRHAMAPAVQPAVAAPYPAQPTTAPYSVQPAPQPAAAPYGYGQGR